MRRFDELTRAVLEGRGALHPALRQAVFDARAEDDIPPAVAAYVAKVAECAYSVTDADVDGLRQAGFDDDQIFELTVAAAVGAGARRLAAGRAALGGGG